jgi:general secretion pathway protein D
MKLLAMNRMSILTVLFVVGILFSITSYAQQNSPAKSIRGEEFVSLNDGLPFNVAIEILNQFCKRFDNKIIIDPQGRQNAIGVVVDNLYWKKAFENILHANNLSYKIYDEYYEIQSGESQGVEVEKDVKVTTATKEVRIEAVFLEVNRDVLSQMGIDWSTLKGNKIEINTYAADNLLTNHAKASYKWTNGVWDVYALIKALENQSIGEVISRPQIQVMEGVEGKVKIGRNFYLTMQDFAGNTQYREFEAGTILSVIPKVITIHDTTFIHLNIKTERSQVVPDPSAVSKDITESKTQTLLLNGEQTTIAGLYSNETTKVRRGIPFLKDLPGWFFGLRYLVGYNSTEVKKKELVIIVKAEILPGITKRKVNIADQDKKFEAQQNKMFNSK